MAHYHFPIKQILVLKHREAQQAHHHGITRPKKINTQYCLWRHWSRFSKKAAIKTKGGCDPSELDADNLRRILVFNQFSPSPVDLQTSIANFVKHLWNTNIHLLNSGTHNSLEAFAASRLIPLNKNPRVQPFGVGEVLHQIAGKVIMYIAKNDARDATRSLQVCAGQEAGSEAVIHIIYDCMFLSCHIRVSEWIHIL